MSEELRPCPFCGGTKICTEKGINLNYCDNCSAESNVEHWNTRPIEDELRSRIAELEEQVWDLNLANEKLESAYFADETIAPDGSLKPSVCKLMKRVEKAETDYSISEAHVTALLNRIAELEAAQRWIPVSERLPEKQKLTIGFTDNSAYVFFEIVNDDEMGLVMYPYQNRKGTVTHWMPLPSTPEVQE